MNLEVPARLVISVRADEFELHSENGFAHGAAVHRIDAPPRGGTLTVMNPNCTEALLERKEMSLVFWQGYFYDAMKQSLAKR